MASPLRSGLTFAAFVAEVFSYKIVGGRCRISMKTKALSLQALNQAIWNAWSTTGLIHHSGHGSQYVAVAYRQHIKELGNQGKRLGSKPRPFQISLVETVSHPSGAIPVLTDTAESPLRLLLLGL